MIDWTWVLTTAAQAALGAIGFGALAVFVLRPYYRAMKEGSEER